MRLGKKQSFWLAGAILVGAFALGVLFLSSREQASQLSPEAEQALLKKYGVPSPSPSTTLEVPTPTPTWPSTMATPDISKVASPAPSLTAGDPGSFRLGNFQRREIKAGKKLWEIEADSGEYVQGSNQVQLKMPRLWLQREDGTVVRMKAHSGVLTIEGSVLNAALISGAVEVIKDDSLTIHTETARYDRAGGTVVCPGYAKIKQDSLIVEGEELTADLNKKTAEFQRNVVTTILPRKER